MSDAATKSVEGALAARCRGAEGDAAACVKLLMSGAHCCAYCVLRLLGVKTMALYQKEPQELGRALATIAGVTQEEAKKDQEEEEEKKKEEQHCPGCADLIASCHDDTFCHELVDAVRGCGYQFESYILNVHLHVAFSIRQHALWLYANEHFPFVAIVHINKATQDETKHESWGRVGETAKCLRKKQTWSM